MEERNVSEASGPERELSAWLKYRESESVLSTNYGTLRQRDPLGNHEVQLTEKTAA